MRNTLLDVTPIRPATACHQRNYVETYSGSNSPQLRMHTTPQQARDIGIDLNCGNPSICPCCDTHCDRCGTRLGEMERAKDSEASPKLHTRSFSDRPPLAL